MKILFAIFLEQEILWTSNIILLPLLHAGNGNIKALVLYDL